MIYAHSPDWQFDALPRVSQTPETAAGADKRKQQPAARQRILRRVGNNKTERHQRVNKIERDIQEIAGVGETAPPRQRAIQAIQQPVQHNGRQRTAPYQPSARNGSASTPIANPASGRQGDPDVEPAGDGIQDGLQSGMQAAIKHGDAPSRLKVVGTGEGGDNAPL